MFSNHSCSATILFGDKFARSFLSGDHFCVMTIFPDLPQAVTRLALECATRATVGACEVCGAQTTQHMQCLLLPLLRALSPFPAPQGWKMSQRRRPGGVFLRRRPGTLVGAAGLGILWRRRRQMGEMDAERATNAGIEGEGEGRKRKGAERGGNFGARGSKTE